MDHLRCISGDYLRSTSTTSILPLKANGRRSRYAIEIGDPKSTPTLYSSRAELSGFMEKLPDRLKIS